MLVPVEGKMLAPNWKRSVAALKRKSVVNKFVTVTSNDKSCAVALQLVTDRLNDCCANPERLIVNKDSTVNSNRIFKENFCDLIVINLFVIMDFILFLKFMMRQATSQAGNLRSSIT